MSSMRKIKDLIRRVTGEVPTDTLVKRGLKVGRNFNRQQGCFIDPTHCFLIEIGNNVTFSIRVTILAHDASTKKILGYTKIGRVIVEDNVFVGANVTILPNTVIGKNSIIGAGSIVTKDVPANTVVAGNPARVICAVEEYKEKYANAEKVFDSTYRYRRNLAIEKIDEIRSAVDAGISFIE